MPTESSLFPNPAQAPKRVAVIHDWLVTYRGGEKVLEAILELFPQAEVFTLFHKPGRVKEKIESHKIHTSFLNHFPEVDRYYRYLLPLFPLAIESFDLTDFDLVISSSHCVAKGVIPGPGALHVCYSHTPMRYAWDRVHDYFGHGAKFACVHPFLHHLRMWDVASSARVDSFAANSGWVAKRIEKYYRRESTVIHPFADISQFSVNTGKRDDYYLVVSAFAPYKRIDLAIETCRRLDRPLKIVGSGQEAARLIGMRGPKTEFLGQLSSDELRSVYANAKALLFPGEEDFGIAPIEAMACGTPVIALSRGGALETVVDGVSGLFFHEPTVDALADAMERFESQTLPPKVVRSIAEKFGRDKFLKQFVEFIEKEWRALFISRQSST